MNDLINVSINGYSNKPNPLLLIILKYFCRFIAVVSSIVWLVLGLGGIVFVYKLNNFGILYLGSLLIGVTSALISERLDD